MSAIFKVDSFASHDQTVLRYGLIEGELHGDNRNPIIFVPGLGGSVKFAIRFLERFVPHHGPVYSLDARGFGLNEAVPPRPTPGGYLNDFHHFLQLLQEKNLVSEGSSPIIIGLSLGAVLTTLYLTENAESHPFKGAVLMAPAFSPHPETFNVQFKLKNYAKVMTKGINAITTLPYGVHDLTRNPDSYDDPNFQDPLSLPLFYLFLVERLCKKAYSNIRKVSVPTAVVVPEKDFVCDPKYMKLAFDRIPHSQKELFTYADLYHDVAMEPDEDQHIVSTDLAQWMASIIEDSKTMSAHVRPA
jgi:alpha-beta hydrolase superfamily lysophospholipase